MVKQRALQSSTIQQVLHPIPLFMGGFSVLFNKEADITLSLQVINVEYLLYMIGSKGNL